MGISVKIRHLILNMIILTVPLLLISGCATTKQYIAMPAQARGAANSEKVRIYVMRTSVVGCAIPIRIKDGDQLIGELERGRYLCWEREPGETVISSITKIYDVFVDDVADQLKLQAEKGSTYYILLKPRMGFLFIRPHNYPRLLTKEAGEKILSKCKPAEIYQKD